MNPLLENLIRRNRAAVLAVLVALGFLLVHTVVFPPALARYRRATQQATDLGVPMDAVTTAPAASARVAELLTDNSLNAAVAEEQGTSGALTAGLLDDVTRLASKHGLEVVATEQGMVTQLPGSVQVRAHFKMRGPYAGFVGLLEELARTRTLYVVDRFAIQQGGGAAGIELWMTQVILKRAGGRR